MIQFPDLNIYLTNFLSGAAVSTISLGIIFLFFDIDAPLRQAMWISVLVSFVNLLPFVEHFFPIPLLAYLLYRRGNLSTGGIIIIVLAWLTLNTFAYTGMEKYMGSKYSMELPGMQNLVQAVDKFMGKK